MRPVPPTAACAACPLATAGAARVSGSRPWLAYSGVVIFQTQWASQNKNFVPIYTYKTVKTVRHFKYRTFSFLYKLSVFLCYRAFRSFSGHVMKGIVFREFISMVENQFSLETADHIISASNLSTDGAYTSVGTYPPQEMVDLVTHLSAATNISVPDLLHHLSLIHI